MIHSHKRYFLVVSLLALPWVVSADNNLSEFVEYTGSGAENLGEAITTGDINNDGYTDTIIAGTNNGSGAEGAVYLVYGQASQLTNDAISNHVQFTGAAVVDYAGEAITTGDLNGDGYDDIVVGANNEVYDAEDDVYSNTGAIYIIYGQSSTLLSGSLSDYTQLTGETAGDNAGSALTTGDLNNDGYDDLMVTRVGGAYIIYGRSSDIASGSLSSYAQLTDEVGYDVNTNSALATGDLNNDGYDDLVVGATGRDDSATDAGGVYLVYGKSSQLLSDSLSNYPLLTGEATSDQAGSALATGDLNNDGYDDLVVGAPYNSDAASNAGAVYVVYGRSTKLLAGSLATRTELTGEANGDYAGIGLATGDLNFDGYGDILIGAYKNDDGGNQAGSTYLLYGQANNIAAGSLSGYLQFIGEAADNSGYNIVAGDVNNDRFADVMISAHSRDSGNGSAYLGYLYRDEDGDGAAGTAGILATGTDCNDADATIISNRTYYQDSDGDGLGNAAVATSSCTLTPPAGYVINAADTDDTVASGDSDNDDDGVDVSTDCNDADSTVSSYQTYYQDNDGDGYGNPDITTSACSSTPPDGYSDNANDDDDTVAYLGIEIGDDDIDNDRDGEIDEVNTLEENGEHPSYANGDVTSGDFYDNSILKIKRAKNGNILVTYRDGSVYRYNAFNLDTDRKTYVEVKPNSSLVVVLHPRTKKLALVNALSGEVLSRKSLNSRAFSKAKLVVKDLRTDNKYEIVVAAKRDNTVRIHVLSLQVQQLELKKQDRLVIIAENSVIKKTRVKRTVILLRNKQGETVERVRVKRSYQLSN